MRLWACVHVHAQVFHLAAVHAILAVPCRRCSGAAECGQRFTAHALSYIYSSALAIVQAHGGSGLGLSICKLLVKMHRGDVLVLVVSFFIVIEIVPIANDCN